MELSLSGMSLRVQGSKIELFDGPPDGKLMVELQINFGDSEFQAKAKLVSTSWTEDGEWLSLEFVDLHCDAENTLHEFLRPHY